MSHYKQALRHSGGGFAFNSNRAARREQERTGVHRKHNNLSKGTSQFLKNRQTKRTQTLDVSSEKGDIWSQEHLMHRTDINVPFFRSWWSWSSISSTSFGGIVTGNGILAYLLSASNVNQTTVYTINMMYWRSLASNDWDHNFTTNEFTKVITVVNTRGVLSCIYIIYIYNI